MFFNPAWCRSRVSLGAWKPVILLPASAITGLSPDQLEAVLAHELGARSSS